MPLFGGSKEQIELMLAKLTRLLVIEVDVQEESESGVWDLLSWMHQRATLVAWPEVKEGNKTRQTEPSLPPQTISLLCVAV